MTADGPLNAETSPAPTRWTRRTFLTAAGMLAVAGTTGVRAAEAATPRLVDTHLHCFAGAKDARFPYHANAPYRPDAAATPEHLLKCMDEAGVAHAIVVHPEPYQDDHRYLEHCLAVGKGRLKGTCLFFADRPGALAAMADLARRTPLVAARIHAYAPDRLPPFGKPELRDLWAKAGELGLAIQLHFEPRYAPGFEPLIREFPHTTVLIDHMGRPFQGTPEEHDRVIRWSEHKNTVLKLSSIPAPTTYPHRDIGPVIKRLVAAFGADRVLYGGGFDAAANGASYRAAFEGARKHLAHLPAADQSKILGENAIRIFKF